MNYTNLVKKKKQYKYSANICFDMKDEEKLAGFIPNITTTEILREYLLGIQKSNYGKLLEMFFLLKHRIVLAINLYF